MKRGSTRQHGIKKLERTIGEVLAEIGEAEGDDDVLGPLIRFRSRHAMIMTHMPRRFKDIKTAEGDHSDW